LEKGISKSWKGNDMKHNTVEFHLSSSAAKERISTLTLAKVWRSSFGLTVDRFFSSQEIELEPVPPYNYYRFTSALSGDADFYSKLMRRIGYEASEKAEFVQAALEIAPGQKVLDVGSGIGNFSTRCPGEYRGIDTNPTAVEDAAKLGRNVHYGLVQDEKPNSYDIVTVFQVLEHVDSPREFISSCVSCLRPGGILIVTTPDMNGFVGYHTNEILNYPPHHMSWWSQSSLQALVNDCGCAVTKVWNEPLQSRHLGGALSALFWPRSEKHLTTSIFFPLFDLGFHLVARIAARRWKNIPFIMGHTMMVVATKIE
jgi:2-polyprenyl-3-methyl-5-hydroxy-6-metoxy-1,4-benzoquinol methylase